MKLFLNKPVLMVTVFMSGFVTLIIEILGTRVLAPFYGSTIYVWSSLIAVTLGALALGYYFGGRVIDRYPEYRPLFITTALAAVFVFVPIKLDQWILPLTDSMGIAWGSLIAAFSLFAIPLFFLGMTSPMAIRLLSLEVNKAGSVAGKVFALGTAGSIAGALISGFYLIPRFSLSFIFASAGMILLLLSLAIFLVSRKSKSTVTALTAILAVFGLSYLAPQYAYTDSFTFSLEDHRQSQYADLKVVTVGGSRCLAANGFTQSCMNTDGEAGFGDIYEIEKMSNEISARSVADGSPLRILLLGVGAGDALRYFPLDAQVDAVDIDPAVIETAREYFGLADRQDQHIIIDDGRRFLRKTNTIYDIIVYDAYVGGTIPSHLITKEAFGLYALHLNAGGVMMVNFGGRPSPDDGLLSSVIKTAKEVFPGVTIASTHPDDPNFFQAAMIYLTHDPVPFFAENLDNRVPIETFEIENRAVLTDTGVGSELLASQSHDLFRKKMLDFGGYRLMFSI